jgi:hypothetical protein
VGGESGGGGEDEGPDPPDDDEGDPRFRAGTTPSTPAGVWPGSDMSDPNWASVTEAQGDGDVTDLDQAQGAIELLMQQLRPRV